MAEPRQSSGSTVPQSAAQPSRPAVARAGPLRRFTQKARRLFLHLFTGPAAMRLLFPRAALARLHGVIVAGEREQSGRVRLIIEAGMPLRKVWRGLSIRQRAVDLFGSFRVWDTEQNNGVLLYLNLAERKLELVCDRAAVRAITPEEWQGICDAILGAFRQNEFERGLTEGLHAIHREMAEYFPVTATGGDAAAASGDVPADDPGSAPVTL